MFYAKEGWGDKDKPLTFTYGCFDENKPNSEVILESHRSRKAGGFYLASGMKHFLLCEVNSSDYR